MIGLDAGAAWTAKAHANRVRVRVRAVFSRAVHVELGPGTILVIVDRDGPSGPLHLRVTQLPAVVAGDELVLDLTSVPRWAPPHVGGRPRYGRLPGSVRSAVVGDTLDRVRTLMLDDNLVAVAQTLGGRGPGLTPAGDDVLAGIVLTRHLFFGASRGRLLATVAVVRTTDLSTAYLRWAARGQCIEPAHAVLAAVTCHDPERLEAAAARLCAHGATSGADLLLGIECALSAVAGVRTGGVPATRP